MYVIKTQKLATHLMSLGFQLVKLDTDKNNPKYNVYLFKDTDELRQAVTEYKKAKSLQRVE